MMRISFGFLTAMLSIALLLPGSAGAQPKDINGVVSVLENILFNVSRIFWIVAVGFTLYAGFLYFTAADNPERLKKAQQQLLYTVIAIAIALMATVIPTLVENILGGK